MQGQRQSKMWVEAESCLLCRKRQQSTARGPGHHLMRVQFQIHQEKKHIPPSCSNREERQGRQRDVSKSRGNLNCSSALLSDVSNQKLKKKKKKTEDIWKCCKPFSYERHVESAAKEQPYLLYWTLVLAQRRVKLRGLYNWDASWILSRGQK